MAAEIDGYNLHPCPLVEGKSREPEVAEFMEVETLTQGLLQIHRQETGPRKRVTMRGIGLFNQLQPETRRAADGNVIYRETLCK